MDQFKPNRCLYLSLLTLTVVLTIMCLLIPQSSPWFTIGTGFSCGALASITVAWLIDGFNCKQAQKKAVEHKKTILKKLISCFDNGLQVLILLCANDQNACSSRKWYEWVEQAYGKTKENTDFCTLFNGTLLQFFSNISDQILLLQSQEALLLEQNIIEEKDIDVLSMMLNICIIAGIEFRANKTEQERSNQLLSYCNSLRMFLNNSPSLELINNKQIRPFKLGKTSVESELKKKDQSDESSNQIAYKNQTKIEQ